jgi:hypothetical protein
MNTRMITLMEGGYTTAQFVTVFLHEALREVAAWESMSIDEFTDWEVF